MSWVDVVIMASVVYLAWRNDQHINRLYRQISELERRLSESEALRD